MKPLVERSIVKEPPGVSGKLAVVEPVDANTNLTLYMFPGSAVKISMFLLAFVAAITAPPETAIVDPELYAVVFVVADKTVHNGVDAVFHA